MLPTARTLGEIVDHAARHYGERTALVVYEEKLSYGLLARRAHEDARLLRGSGLSPGDRVAIWLPNGTRFVELAFGCALAGLVVVPLNTRLKHADAAHALAKSGARALFFMQEFIGIDFYGLVEGILSDVALPKLEIVVNLDNGEGGRIRAARRWREETRPAEDLPAVGPDMPAFINFTSGTTSRPKGAVVGHGTFVHIAREVARRMQYGPHERVASAMPFYHNGGFVPTLLTSLLTGSTLYTQPRFDPDYALDTIDRYRCSVVSGTGTLFTMMLDSPALARTDFASVRAVRIPGPADMRRAVKARFGHPMLYSLYGMTETTAAVTLTEPDDSLDEQLNTNGKPLPGVTIRIAGADGGEVARGEHGEIWIHGTHCLMQGYFDEPEATAQVLTPDGWMRSGDLGFVDPRGNLVLVGRIKDMYRSGGENVACAEVEEFLRGHPAVLHAAVLGVPDPRLDEVGLAFVELRAGATASEQELKDYCRRNLANFKVPRHIRFRQGLPLTVSGRVEKHRLRNDALAAANGNGKPQKA